MEPLNDSSVETDGTEYWFRDERDHAWHTDCYYDECRLCHDEFEESQE